jgi:putative acetyltransferase
MKIRSEAPGDETVIREITDAAFAGKLYSSGTEGAIVDALRAAGDLSLSLVAEGDGRILGHVAFSPVTVDGAAVGWFGLGPVSVRPERQRQGIGSALIREGLAQLRERGAGGCVLLGARGYYQRFGFANDPGLRYEGAPPEHFMRLSFGDDAPQGVVKFHPAFGDA